MASYAVGMNTDQFVSSKTLISLTKMFNAAPEDFRSRLILVEGGCGDFADSRNKMVRAFLGTALDWLLIVDTDMVWEPEDWARLRDSADPEHPWVSGTYFVDNAPPAPCAVTFDDQGKAYHPILSEDSPELLRVSAACVGFGLIHRSVFLEAADVTNDHEWFEHGWRAPNGQTLSEDWAFCARAGEAGIPIHLNTKVRVGHLKSRILGWADYGGSDG